MDGLPCKEDYFCAAPLCLLYVNACKQLVPIAIQLKRQPAEDNPIFLPTDNRVDWLLAKMYFSNASAQVRLSKPMHLKLASSVVISLKQNFAYMITNIYLRFDPRSYDPNRNSFLRIVI